MVGRSQAPLTWGVEHDEDRGVLLQKLVKVFIGQVINGAALICPGSLGDLGLWRLRTGRPKTGRAQSTPWGLNSPYKIQPLGSEPPWLGQAGCRAHQESPWWRNERRGEWPGPAHLHCPRKASWKCLADVPSQIVGCSDSSLGSSGNVTASQESGGL